MAVLLHTGILAIMNYSVTSLGFTRKMPAKSLEFVKNLALIGNLAHYNQKLL